MFELVLSSAFLVLIRLYGEFILERSRRTTACEVAQALAGSGGGLVVDTRARHNAIVVYIPSPLVSQPLTRADDYPAA
jgi:hypothetical protein